MLAFSHYVSSLWVVIPGIVFLVGRQLFAHLYVKDPQSRTPGFLMTFFANMALVLGSLIAIVWQLVS